MSKDVEIEEKKPEFDKLQANNDRKFLYKNVGILISSIISIGAIIVSLLQMKIAENNKAKEMEMQKNQFTQQLQLQKADAKHQWDIDILNFVTDNSEKIFNGSITEKEKIKNIILVIFPPDITDSLFANIEETTTDSTKSIWKKGRKQSADIRRRGSRKALPKSK